MEEVSKEQELRDILWFGQTQILGELVNADPLKAQSEPKNTRAIALKFTFALKNLIDKEVEQLPDVLDGRSEVFVSAVQILGRYVNADYHKAINNPDETVKFAFEQAIYSITELESEFRKLNAELVKKESEVTEE